MRLDRIVQELKAVTAELEAAHPGLQAEEDLWLSAIQSLTDAEEMAAALVERALEEEALASGAKARAKELQARAARLDAAANRYRAAALSVMEAAGIRRAKGPGVTISMRDGAPPVIIEDATKLPLRFVRMPPPEPMKRDIGEALRRGEEVPGATLGNGARPFLHVTKA